MHELSVAAYMLERVEQHAIRVDASKITAINLVVGERACIVDDALRFSFELLAEGSVAEGATINFRWTPMRFQCETCDRAFTPVEGDFRCPDCQTIGQVTDDGSDLVIESLEISQ